jgi:uncharacterized protein (DUF305 family)
MPSIAFVIVVIKRTLASLVVTASIALLAACGGGDADSGATSETDADDTMFVQGMIPHHQQALDMSTLALDGRAGEAVVELAGRITAAQDVEIATMRGMLARWGVEEDEHAMHRSGDHSSMMGMLTEEQFDGLTALSGDEFDRAWLEAMIMHHEGAIAMAEAVLADGIDEEVRALATAIVAAQRAEIAEMQALLDA